MSKSQEIQRRGKQQRGKQTKKQLLQTALNLFSEKGYQNVTVDEIVEKSNSSKGSFYFHFGSKHSVFMEKFKEIDQYYSDFYRTFPENIPTHDKILLFVGKQMDYIQYELGKDLMKVIYSNAIMTDENKYFTDQDRPLFKILGEILVEGQEKNEIDTSLSVESLKLIIMQGLMGSIYHWCMANETYSLRETSEEFFLSLINGLRIHGN